MAAGHVLSESNDEQTLAKGQLEAGAVVNRADRFGIARLSIEAEAGNVAPIRELLAAKTDVIQAYKDRWRTDRWRTALRVVAPKNQLEAKTDVIQAYKDRWRTALSWAAENGHDEVVRELVLAGAVVNRADRFGIAPLSIEAAARIRELLAAKTEFLGAMLCIMPEGTYDIREIIGVLFRPRFSGGRDELGRDILWRLINTEADVNICGPNGDTALHHMAKRCDVELVRALLDRGASAIMCDVRGRTARECITQGRQGALECQEMLGKAEIKERLRELLVLIVVSRRGNQRQCRLPPELWGMIAQDYFDIDPEKFTTPLHEAAKMGQIDVVRALIAGGENVNWADPLGDMPLHKAAQVCAVEVIRELLAAGASADAKNNKGQTPRECISKMDLDAPQCQAILSIAEKKEEAARAARTQLSQASAASARSNEPDL